MRCKTCDYPLWNLKARQCPECGTAFRPSEFEYAPNSVSFLCPYCEHAYTGNTEQGRIEPADFACAGCGVRIHFDQMLVAPVGSLEDSAHTMPWLERRTRGNLRAFLSTVGLALVRPGRLMRSIPVSASVGEALSFGTAIMVMVTAIGVVIPVLLMTGTFRVMGGFGLVGLLYLVLPAIAGMLATLLVWPLMAHLLLKWTGGCRHSIDRTIQAFGYAAGANIVSAVPCVGPYTGWLWWMVSSILMLRQAQRVSGLRSTLAVLAFPISLGLVAMLFYLVITQWMSAGIGMAGAGGPPGGWGGNAQQTWFITSQIQQSSWSGNQRPPSHAIELLMRNSTLMMQIGAAPGGANQPFCQTGTRTTPDDIPIGESTLAKFLKAGQSTQFKLASQAIEQLPANAAAHRVGDFIFTIPPNTSPLDPNAWVVVMLPDPDINGVPQPNDQIFIGSGDGTVTATTYAQLPAALAQQNQYRSANGFPTLPDLLTIKQGAAVDAAEGSDPPPSGDN